MTTTIKDAASIVSSKIFTVNVRDALRGLAIATLYAAFLVIQQGIFSDAGFSGIKWDQALLESVRAGIAYVGLNFFTQSKVMIKNPSEQLIDTVKEAKESNTPVKVSVTTPSNN